MEMNEDKLPMWYWEDGLHDSVILNVSKVDNDLVLEIDSTNACYDTSVVGITFKDVEVGDFDISLLVNAFWLFDDLKQVDDKFVLSLQFDTKNIERKFVEITFKDCLVNRK